MRKHPILEDISKAGIRLGIDRFLSFIKFLGNPLTHFPVIHVAGTNGKGSIVRMLESCLNSSNYRVGAYISPHLIHINERIRVGNTPISDQELSSLLEDTYEQAKEWGRISLQLEDDIPITHFELLTATAFRYFSEQKVDIAIVEVGLGGRYDATNIVSPIVSVIASISRDHMELLGFSEASIAAEKAGIIKDRVPVVVGSVRPEALRSIRAIAHERSSAMYVLGDDIRVRSSSDGIDISFLDHVYNNFPIPLLGSHQIDNMALAITVLQLIKTYFPMAKEHMIGGLKNLQYQGRLEWITENVLVDCAHNEAGARQLGSFLMNMKRDIPKNLVIGVSQEKDFRSIILSIAPHVDQIYTIASEHPRAIPAAELQEIIEELRLDAVALSSIEEIHEGINIEEELLVVCGSIFLVGEYLFWRQQQSIVPFG